MSLTAEKSTIEGLKADESLYLNTTAQTFADHLNKHEKFSFARYGDGEWNAIFQKPGHNCDGHEYFSDMGEYLAQNLEAEPDYYVGLPEISMRVRGERIRGFLEPIGKLKWVNADLLHLASVEDTIWPFFEALDKRRVILVGPPHVHDQKLFRVKDSIIIPEKNCWLEYPLSSIEINRAISAILWEGENPVVCYCASMMTKVLVDDFSDRCTNIDLGSLIDPYVGRITRTHHRTIKNLGEWKQTGRVDMEDWIVKRK